MIHRHTEKRDRREIKTQIINIHHKPYAEEVPQEAEGFECVDTVEFRPFPFEDPESETLFRKYLF